MAEGDSAYRFLRTYGSGAVAPRADAVRRLHDVLYLADGTLPLA